MPLLQTPIYLTPSDSKAKMNNGLTVRCPILFQQIAEYIQYVHIYNVRVKLLPC